MSEANKPFVVTDRRKFTLDGAPRPDAERPERDTETPAPSVPVEPAITPTEPVAAAPESDFASSAEMQPEGDLPALTPRAARAKQASVRGHRRPPRNRYPRHQPRHGTSAGNEL